MGTSENNQYNYESDWTSISLKELKKLRTSGISLDSKAIEDCIVNDQTFEWKGQKVIIYIKEQWGDKEYKYHISNCSTLVNMRIQGRFQRYVISNRSDGIFQVTRRNFSRQITNRNIEIPMDVCKNCLTGMMYHYPQKRNFFLYNQFDLQKFLNQYHTKINPLPQYNNNTVPDNEYPQNWNEISKKYRSYQNWECEKCGKDCNDNQKDLHCHHKGPKYDNNWSSLQALCKDCHRLEPGHGRMV